MGYIKKSIWNVYHAIIIIISTLNPLSFCFSQTSVDATVYGNAINLIDTTVTGSRSDTSSIDSLAIKIDSLLIDSTTYQIKLVDDINVNDISDQIKYKRGNRILKLGGYGNSILLRSHGISFNGSNIFKGLFPMHNFSNYGFNLRLVPLELLTGLEMNSIYSLLTYAKRPGKIIPFTQLDLETDRLGGGSNDWIKGTARYEQKITDNLGLKLYIKHIKNNTSLWDPNYGSEYVIDQKGVSLWYDLPFNFNLSTDFFRDELLNSSLQTVQTELSDFYDVLIKSDSSNIMFGTSFQGWRKPGLNAGVWQFLLGDYTNYYLYSFIRKYWQSQEDGQYISLSFDFSREGDDYLSKNLQHIFSNRYDHNISLSGVDLQLSSHLKFSETMGFAFNPGLAIHYSINGYFKVFTSTGMFTEYPGLTQKFGEWNDVGYVMSSNPNLEKETVSYIRGGVLANDQKQIQVEMDVYYNKYDDYYHHEYFANKLRLENIDNISMIGANAVLSVNNMRNVSININYSFEKLHTDSNSLVFYNHPEHYLLADLRYFWEFHNKKFIPQLIIESEIKSQITTYNFFSQKDTTIRLTENINAVLEMKIVDVTLYWRINNLLNANNVYYLLRGVPPRKYVFGVRWLFWN